MSIFLIHVSIKPEAVAAQPEYFIEGVLGKERLGNFRKIEYPSQFKSSFDSIMNPYEADPVKIPEGDRFKDVPLYGRYLPREDDFRPDEKHINSNTPESMAYWEAVLNLCDDKIKVCPGNDGARDVFALGSVIIKSGHLRQTPSDDTTPRDYRYSDANEIKAIELARGVLDDIKVPKIFFAGKILGHDVLIQSRIPGVGLNVAWDYITAEQKLSFKAQARDLLQMMHALPSQRPEPSYICPDLDPIRHRGVQELEFQLLFEGDVTSKLGFMHNDLTQSNIIVDRNKIVGLIDWEMAGYFEWNAVAKVHQAIRSPNRESYARLDLPEDFLSDILYWNDLYS